MKCKYCMGRCCKAGKKNGIQRYKCIECGKSFQENYARMRIEQEKYIWVKNLTCEGSSISSIARLLHISKSSVQRIIERTANKINYNPKQESGQSYEIDELRTYCKNKNNESWLIYAINKHTGSVIDFCVGRRNKINIDKVVSTVLSLIPNQVYTDGLKIYPLLIPSAIHKVFKYSTNKIERTNLTLRTHLKRLSRKTICYTKSNNMLLNCMKIYSNRFNYRYFYYS